MRFGTCKVRALVQIGNMQNLAEETEKYKWKCKGLIHKIKIYTILFRKWCKENRQGLEFVTSKIGSKSVLSFTQISKRFGTLVKILVRITTFITIHDLIQGTEDEVIDLS